MVLDNSKTITAVTYNGNDWSVGKLEQSKTLTLGAATPSTVTPDSGKVLSSVPVVLDTSVIKAENIKKDVIMLGVAGSYEGGSGSGSEGSSQSGFSVTFPAAGSNNYSNWSNFSVAYILKADGTLLDITDYTVVAGKTIDGVVLFTAGGNNSFGLRFTFKGKVTRFEPNRADAFSYLSVVYTFNDTTVRNSMASKIYQNQFFIPNSDLTITSISAYNTD